MSQSEITSSSSSSSSSSERNSKIKFPLKTKYCIKNAHNGPIYTLATTWDGNFILSGGNDKIIKLWNPHTNFKIKDYENEHNYDIHSVIVHKDKSSFLSAGGDRCILHWDVKTGRVISKYWSHISTINCLCYEPYQYDCFASASYDQTVCLWDLKSFNRKPIQKISGDFKDSVTHVAIQNFQIVTACVDGFLRIYDVRNGHKISDKIGQSLTNVNVSEDGKCILVSCLDNKVRLLDNATGDMLNEYKGHINKEYKVSSIFGFEDSYVISGSEDGKIFFWDLVSTKLIHQLDSKTSFTSTTTTTTTNKNSSSSSSSSSVNLSQKTPIITQVVQHPKDSNILFSCDTLGNIYVWN